MPQDKAKVAATIRPDYSLGSHRAPLGLAFSNAAMGGPFSDGVFVGEHGSWNRKDVVGYRVSFIRFQGGRPTGNPVDFVSGFLKDGKARGRPVGRDRRSARGADRRRRSVECRAGGSRRRGPHVPLPLQRVDRGSKSLIAVALAVAAIQPAEIIITGRLNAEADKGAVVMDRDRLSESASGRIEDVLADIPGLQSFRRSDSRSANASAQGLTLRGLGGNASSRTLVLLDGIPVADPFFGFVPLSAIDPARIGTVTVVKGAGGGHFGSAVAGAIDFASIAPAERAPWSARAAVSSGQAMELGAGLALPLGASRVTIDGRWDAGRGFWTTPRSQRVAASRRAAFDARSIDARVIAPMAGGEIQARVLGYADDRRLRFAGADSRSAGVDASLRYAAANGKSVLAAYVQRRDFSNIVVSATSFRPVLDQYRTPATGAGLMAQFSPRRGYRSAPTPGCRRARRMSAPCRPRPATSPRNARAAARSALWPCSPKRN